MTSLILKRASLSRPYEGTASTTTLPTSLASALRSRLRFGAVPAK